MKVIGHEPDGLALRVVGTCRPPAPEPAPGEWLRVCVPAPELGEDPVWGPLFYRELRWPVVRLDGAGGEAAVLFRRGGPDPALLPGWAPEGGQP